MFQPETFDIEINKRELSWANDLGFNSVRVYLHGFLWSDPETFKNILDQFLDICARNKIRPMLVLFDDCHRPYPKLGVQPKPVKGVHNSGWKQSPGMALVSEIHDNDSHPEIPRLKSFVQEVLGHFGNDQRMSLIHI